jgi:ribosomal protein L32
MEALLRTELGYDEDWFQACVSEAQLKEQNHVIKCPSCARVIVRGKAKCIYCEQSVEIDDIFHFINITPVSLPKNVTVKRATAEKSVEYAYEKVLELEKSLEPLLSIAETLWVILKERFGFSDEQLAKRLGQEKPQPQEAWVCPSCGRTVGNGRTSCLYCGTLVNG